MTDVLSLHIDNFQILNSVDLEFGVGLNTIVGESNNGKSSVLKALQSLFYTIPRNSIHTTRKKSI